MTDRTELSNDPAIEVISPTGEIVPFTKSGPAFRIPGVVLSETSLTLPDDLGFADWTSIGEIFGSIERRLQWCIGDWWAFGNKKYGERAHIVNDPSWSGPNFAVCATLGSVARKFDRASRILEVPFGVHQAACGMPKKDEALALLERASRYGMSETQVRAEVRAYKRRGLADGRTVHSVGSAEVQQLDEFEFAKQFATESVDLLITDPPYSSDVDNIEEFSAWVHRWLPKVKPSGRAYIFTGAYPIELASYIKRLCPPPNGWTLDNPLVWTYRNTLGPAPTHSYKLNWQACFHLYGPSAPPLNCPWMTEQFSVQDHGPLDIPPPVNAPDGRQGDRFHSWQKPDELAERLIFHSTSEQQLVVDPFCGSGTFVLAAKRLARIGKGADIDEDAIAICKQRIESADAL